MKVAIIQINSHLDPEENLKKITKYLKKAVRAKAVAAFLPEVFYSMSDGLVPTPYLVKPGNEHYKAIQNLAKKNNIAILAGTAATGIGSQIVNRSYNFDAKGKDLGFYDKIHMFKCLIQKNNKIIDIDENRVYSKGSRLTTINLLDWKIGLSTCFDLRYPEVYQTYKNQKVDVITASSAFTQTTGKDHWHILVRARAIETQSFIIAANQTGQHNPKMKSYGHSLIVDPWGKILVDMKKEEGVAIVNLDKNALAESRSRIIL